MIRRAGPARATLAIAALLLLPPTIAPAQGLVELRVVRYGTPVEGMVVSVLVEGEPWSVGATGGDGVVEAPIDLVGLSEGVEVVVFEIGCPGGENVLLVPPAESPERACELRGPGGRPCGCAPLGSFAWGGDATIDLGAMAVEGAGPGGRAETVPGPRPEPRAEPEPREPGPPAGVAPSARAPWTIAIGAGLSSWPNLDRGCRLRFRRSVSSCDVDAERPVIRASAEYRLDGLALPISLAGGFGYAPGLEVEHRLADAPGPRDPLRNTVEIDVLTFEGWGVGRYGARPDLDLFLALGYVWAYNRAEATTLFGDLVRSEERDDSGGRIGGRAGLDWWRGERWGVRFQLGGMAGEDEDIDTSWYGAISVLLPAGTR